MAAPGYRLFGCCCSSFKELNAAVRDTARQNGGGTSSAPILFQEMKLKIHQRPGGNQTKLSARLPLQFAFTVKITTENVHGYFRLVGRGTINGREEPTEGEVSPLM